MSRFAQYSDDAPTQLTFGFLGDVPSTVPRISRRRRRRQEYPPRQEAVQAWFSALDALHAPAPQQATTQCSSSRDTS
jgi:hypothetical protein